MFFEFYLVRSIQRKTSVAPSKQKRKMPQKSIQIFFQNMKTKNFFRFLALFSLVSFLSIAEVPAKDEWISARSKNFQLIGDASEKDIRGVAVKLEQFREVFRRFLSRANFEAPTPIKVIVFKNNGDFDLYKPVKENGKVNKNIVGYFLSGEDSNYIALSVGCDEKETYGTIFHEYVHFIIKNSLGNANVPPWINEGLAEYYQTISVAEDERITLGALQHQYLSLLRQNKLIPLDVFFNIDNYSLHQQSDDGVGLFYAQAWALMHYLIHGKDGARKAQMYKFLELAASGKSSKKAFEEAFKIDFAAMENELKKYVEQTSYRISIASFKEKIVFDSRVEISPFSDLEAKSTLGELLLHSNRLSEAETHFTEILLENPDLSSALIGLGLVKMRQKKFAEAKKLLEKAVANDQKNYLAFYNYAEVLSRENMTDFGFVSEYDAANAQTMRRALRKAIELNPNFAPSYGLFAFVSAVRNDEVDEAIEYLQKALAIAPGNPDYLIRQAELYLRKENYSSARSIAQKVLQSVSDKETKLYAQNTLERINSTEAQMEAIKNYKPRPDPEYVTEKPLSEEELARRRARAELESLNEILRKPKAGEKRILGYLTEINCSGKGMIYTVKADNQSVKFNSQLFETVAMIAFDSAMAEKQIGCGTLKKESLAVFIYRPNADAKTKIAGELTSIQFVPQTFRFLY